jgi:hypothetical protein
MAIAAARQVLKQPWAAGFPQATICIVADSANNYKTQFTNLLDSRR